MIKIILGGKIVVAVAVLAAYSGWLRFEEVPVLAKDSEEVKKQSEDAGQEGVVEVSSQKKGEESKEGRASAEVLLEGLLELPKASGKKEEQRGVGVFLRKADAARKQVEGRIGVLKKRVATLRGIEKSIDEKLERLDQEKKFLLATLQKEKEVQGERLSTLVLLYEKMEPKKAAPVLAKMNKDLVVALFNQLKKKTVTKFLEGMPEDQALAITEYFGRISSAKEYELLREVNVSLKKEFADCKATTITPEEVGDSEQEKAPPPEKSKAKSPRVEPIEV